MQILVIGSPPAVWGFSLAGVPGQIVATAEEVAEALDDALKRSELGLILITEDVANLARDRVERLIAQSAMPLVIEIPGPDGSSPDRPSIQELLHRTIGVKV